MSLPVEVKRQLGQYLLQRLQQIGTQVTRAIRSHTDAIPNARSLTDQELIDHFPELFTDLAEYLLREADPQMRRTVVDAATKHGETRSQQGYDLAELVREIGIVQSATVDHGLEEFLIAHPDFADSAGGCSEIIGAFFEDSVVGSVQRYVDKFNEESRLTNEKLRAANERLNELDAFRLQLIRTVHHELGNALNALNFSIEAAALMSATPAQTEMLNSCRRSAEEMKSLLSQLNDYSVLIGGELPVYIEPIDIAPFARELEATLRAMVRNAGMSLEMQIDPQLNSIESDRARITQMIHNLVSNAVKYGNVENKGAKVVIRFQSKHADFWQLSVEDFGAGIPQEHLKAIFQEFKRFSPSENIAGHGLGLAITQGLAAQLRGTIEVSSEVNRGSRFTVTLPKWREK